MKRILLVYYSYTGHTKKIADFIWQQLHCDRVELQPEIPYASDYNVVVEQGQQEVQQNYMPVLKNTIPDLTQYDTIILGSPIWWYTIAPVVRSFLNQHTLASKTIYPFVTNGGYGIGHSLADMQELCPQAQVEACFDVPFEGEQLQLQTSIIDQWINTLKGE